MADDISSHTPHDLEKQEEEEREQRIRLHLRDQFDSNNHGEDERKTRGI